MPEEKSPEQIFSSKNIPFTTEGAARAAMTQKGMSPEEYRVTSYKDGDQEGYVIVPKPKQVSETYWEVIFSHKSNPNDQDDVTLSVNGEVLNMQRGVKVIIPGRFRECADHATYPQFTQKPNESRKIVGTVMVFPYQTVREATEKEYRALLREGTKKTKEDMAAATKLI